MGCYRASKLCTQSQWNLWSKFSNTNFRTLKDLQKWRRFSMTYLTLWKHGFLQNSSWLTESIKKEMFQKCQRECGSQKEYLGYITLNILPGTENLHLVEINCQFYWRWNVILYIQLLKSYVLIIIPCGHYTLFLSWVSWVNNYGWECFGCSSNCLAPNVTIFKRIQFSGKGMNFFFTIFYSIYFWSINYTMTTNFWHNREK